MQTFEANHTVEGYPQMIRGGHGSGFISRDLDLWTYANGFTLDFSRPGKPVDNAHFEDFDGRCCVLCLNTHWFLTLVDSDVTPGFRPAEIRVGQLRRRAR